MKMSKLSYAYTYRCIQGQRVPDEASRRPQTAITKIGIEPYPLDGRGINRTFMNNEKISFEYFRSRDIYPR